MCTMTVPTSVCQCRALLHLYKIFTSARVNANEISRFLVLACVPTRTNISYARCRTSVTHFTSVGLGRHSSSLIFKSSSSRVYHKRPFNTYLIAFTRAGNAPVTGFGITLAWRCLFLPFPVVCFCICCLAKKHPKCLILFTFLYFYNSFPGR